MEPERISIGKPVRVREHYKIADRGGMVGMVVDHYGAEGYVIMDVLFSDRPCWLFWAEDLEVLLVESVAS